MKPGKRQYRQQPQKTEPVREMKKPLLAVVGEYQQGKSTLINCLLDDPYAPTGKGLTTTKALSYYRFGEAEEAWISRDNGKSREQLTRREILYDQNELESMGWAGHNRIEITCWKPLLARIDLLDTPGFNAYEQDDRLALTGVEEADTLAVVVADKQLSSSEIRLLDEIVRRRKRYVVIVNCRTFEHWDPEHETNIDICSEISAQLMSKGHQPIDIGGHPAIWPCNLLWAWHALGHLWRETDLLDDSRGNDAKMKMKMINAHFKDSSRYEHPPKPRELMSFSKFLTIRKAIESLTWSDISNGFEKEGHELINKAMDCWQNELKECFKIRS